MLKKYIRTLMPEVLLPSTFINRYIVQTVASGRLAAGIFEGMFYPPMSICGQNVPKFLGTYEIELLPVFERLRRIDFQQIFDVGSCRRLLCNRLLPALAQGEGHGL